MNKQNYTHIQELLPEIKAMLAEGKTQREVAEHYGFKGKYVGKAAADTGTPKRAKAGSRDSSTAERKATKRFCAQRYYRGAGIRDQTFENGE